MNPLAATSTHYRSGFVNYFAFDISLLADPSMIGRLVLQVVLLMCSGFFSGSETALFSLSQMDLQKLRRQRHRNSDTLHALAVCPPSRPKARAPGTRRPSGPRRRRRP